ncbi:MAG: Arc family DNA-binding protein [Gammaproteobacteria bacterium]|nr:Arc family DNA-binding protein [Gammaproteobacteria bacterium]
MKKEVTDKFVVRLPRALRNQLASIARLYRRSMNAELIIRLEYSLNGIPDHAREKALEPLMFPQIERVIRGDLTEDEERLLLSYRRMDAERQLALFKLIT